jgi:hypothetical protein
MGDQDGDLRTVIGELKKELGDQQYPIKWSIINFFFN